MANHLLPQAVSYSDWALGVLQNRATTDLAQELACTVSHIYNLRASIRKKWNLDTDIPLSAALNQAQEERAHLTEPRSGPRREQMAWLRHEQGPIPRSTVRFAEWGLDFNDSDS